MIKNYKTVTEKLLAKLGIPKGCRAYETLLAHAETQSTHFKYVKEFRENLKEYADGLSLELFRKEK